MNGGNRRSQSADGICAARRRENDAFGTMLAHCAGFVHATFSRGAVRAKRPPRLTPVSDEAARFPKSAAPR